MIREHTVNARPPACIRQYGTDAAPTIWPDDAIKHNPEPSEASLFDGTLARLADHHVTDRRPIPELDSSEVRWSPTRRTWRRA